MKQKCPKNKAILIEEWNVLKRFLPLLSRLLQLIAWLTLMAFLSRQSGQETAELSGRLSAMLLTALKSLGIRVAPITLHMFLRKTAHVIAYAVLGVLMYRTILLVCGGRWSVALTVFICTAISILDEYQKMFIPGRHCHGTDILLNAACGILGITAAIIAENRKKKH